MSRKMYPIVLMTVAALMTGCASTQKNASPRVAQGGAENPFANNVEEMDSPAILPRTHFAAGQLFEQQGLTAKAIEQYRKAIAVGHDYLPGYHRLAMLLSKTQRHQEAVRVLTQATLVKPGNPILRNNLGFEYAYLQDWAKAEREVRRAIKLKPDFARAHVNLGMILSRNGQFDQALASFQKVLPESDAHYNLGLMFRSQQRYQDATWAFYQAIKNDPQFVAAQTQIDDLAPRLALMGIPDAKHARVQFFRSNPEGIYPKDASRLDNRRVASNVVTKGHAPSEATYGHQRSQTGQAFTSAQPFDAAFRFDPPAPSMNGALGRGDRFSSRLTSRPRWDSDSFDRPHPIDAFFTPAPLADGSLVAYTPAPQPDGRLMAFAPPPQADGSLVAFSPSPQSGSSFMAFAPPPQADGSLMAFAPAPLRDGSLVQSGSRMKSPSRASNGTRPQQRTKRTMASTIVPSMESKLRSQGDRLRKIRNRIRQLERDFGHQLDCDDPTEGFESRNESSSSDGSQQ